MIIVSSPKGGQGCTTVAVALARMGGRMLIDTAGDAPAACGMAGEIPGVRDMLHQGEFSPKVLQHLAIDGWLVPSGISTQPVDYLQWGRLAGIAPDAVIDAGTDPEIATLSGFRVMVARNCYLALRRAMLAPPPDVVVLISEPNRPLTAADVAAALKPPWLVEVKWDPSVARAVDAGLLSARMPAALQVLREVM